MTQSLPSMASLIYVNDISQPSDAQVKPFSLTIWRQAPGIRSINLRLQKYLDQIVTCCDKWRIKLIPEKTNLINFSRGKVINYAAITMYRQPVKVTQSVKSLGIPYKQNDNCKIKFNQCYPLQNLLTKLIYKNATLYKIFTKAYMDYA